MKGAWKVSGKRTLTYFLLKGKAPCVWKVSESCLEGVLKVSERGLEGAWKVSRKWLEGVQIMSGFYVWWMSGCYLEEV